MKTVRLKRRAGRSGVPNIMAGKMSQRDDGSSGIGTEDERAAELESKARRARIKNFFGPVNKMMLDPNWRWSPILEITLSK